MTGKKHRFLFNKAALLRDATAEVVKEPKDKEHAAYLRGLCDGCHGTTEGPIARAIHVARQVLLAVKEG